jgi:hypothetical protein
MAGLEIKLSALTASAALTGTELLYLVQGGASRRSTAADVAGVLVPGYIDGLNLVWVSNTALTVTSGTAYVPSLGRGLKAAANIAKTGLALTASSWYHVYLWLNGAAADVEIVTTAPSAVYNGTARTKTGDTTRRYLGSVLTDASGNIYSFVHFGTTVQYKANFANLPFRVINNGVAVVATTVGLSGVIPVTSVRALMSTTNDDTAQAAVFGCSDQGYTLDSSNWSSLLNPKAGAVGPYVIDGSQAIQYMYRGAPTSSVNARVAGYDFTR